MAPKSRSLSLAYAAVLGERLTPGQMAGGALVLFGVFLSNRIKA